MVATDHRVRAQFAPLVEAGLAFDIYLPSGTPLRAEALSYMLTEGKRAGNSKYQISHKLRPFFETDDSLLRNPVFWTEQVSTRPLSALPAPPHAHVHALLMASDWG